MGRIYNWIIQWPGWFVLLYVALIGSMWAVPTFLVLRREPWFLMFRIEPWDRMWDWATIVFQSGTLLLALVGGTVALFQWHQEQSKRYEDRVRQIIDQKPVVFTDSTADGGYEIRNLGSAYAFNVWMVVGSKSTPIALGSLDTQQARTLPESVATILNQSEAKEHILLAAARPVPLPRDERRPYTVTFNARTTEGTFRHGFDNDPPRTRLIRDGPVRDYFAAEGEELLKKLTAFVAEA